MENNNQDKKFVSTAVFFGEISLISFGLCGVSVIGVNSAFSRVLPLVFVIFGLFVGIWTTIVSFVGVFCLHRKFDGRLKYFSLILIIFLLVQFVFLVDLQFFNDELKKTDEETGFVIVLTVNLSLTLVNLFVVALNLKRNSSNVESLKV